MTLNRSSQASAWFDLLRWFAALYVVVFHLRPVLFVGSSALTAHQFGAKLVYGLTSLGYQFVMLFFVLSGFLIGSSVLKRVQNGTWSWSDYLLQRLTRLWIVLLPALVLAWIWARVEVGIFHDNNYFVSTTNLHTFVGNLLFLQGVFVPNFSQNLPLWSLTYEFWYYMMFPCVILMIRSKNWKNRLLYGLVLMLMIGMVGKSIVLYFAIWLLGVCIAVLPTPKSASKSTMVVSLSLLSFIVAPVALLFGKIYITKYHVANFDMVRSFPADFVVAAVFAAILYLVFHLSNSRIASPGFKHTSVSLAGFSYTLYLTHYPIINLLRVAVGNGTWGVWHPTLVNLATALAILVGILFYAWLIAQLTEARTTQFRDATKLMIRSGYRAARRFASMEIR
ncbi:acyltransferase family protein [Alicyclobacillus ferrooxydans]|nr:acyltransferase [Alicyclobacillus ferrooxydans]